jgi:signal transduction histidine kinase
MDDIKTPDRKEPAADIDLLEEFSRVNNELTDMHRELGKMNAELHHLNIDLQAKNAEMVHFVYAVSHDLRTPLVTIKTFLDHLTKDMALNDAARVEKDLAYISSAASKMETLLAELLNFSRIGRIANPSVEVPLQDIVRDALNVLAGKIDRLSVRLQVTDEPVMLYGDRVWLVEVFQNLIDNAMKFMGDQREPLVEIGIEKTHGETVFFVRDNGIGIDLRHLDKIFGLFERIDGAMAGTGIGLAVVKRVVELHGGRIWSESEGPGLGACFKFTLPGKHGSLV